MGMRFTDRGEAGRLLAAALPQFRGRADTVVLGLARGGVPVAAAAADALRLPFGALPVRKLGVPGHEETAFGALAWSPGKVVRVLNRPLVVRLLELGIPQSSLDRVEHDGRAELERRAERYPGTRDELRGRTVILADDGLATGASMRAAIEAVRRAGAARVVVAVPVAVAGRADVPGAVRRGRRQPLHPRRVPQRRQLLPRVRAGERRRRRPAARQPAPAARQPQDQQRGVTCGPSGGPGRARCDPALTGALVLCRRRRARGGGRPAAGPGFPWPAGRRRRR